jgi:hypothetical protein
MQLRAALDSPPLCGAGRVEDTLNLRGHALRQAVDLAAQELGTAAEAIVAAAGLVLMGHSSLKAARDRDWGERSARASARRTVLEEVERWKRWLEPQPSLVAPEPPRPEMLDTMGQMVEQDTAPDPAGGPGARRSKQQVAPDRRISMEDKDMRHGRKSSAKTFTGFKAHLALDVDSTVTREVVVCPANAPEHEAVELRAETWEQGPGLLQLDIDLGEMASPRMAPWATQGGPIIARPWPPGGDLCTKNDFPLDCVPGTVTCPQGETVPMIPGRDAQFPASACEACPVRVQCTKARLGQGRSLHSREDEPFQHKLRAKSRTKRGRASLRKRTAVEHAISHQ